MGTEAVPILNVTPKMISSGTTNRPVETCNKTCGKRLCRQSIEVVDDVPKVNAGSSPRSTMGAASNTSNRDGGKCHQCGNPRNWPHFCLYFQKEPGKTYLCDRCGYPETWPVCLCHKKNVLALPNALGPVKKPGQKYLDKLDEWSSRNERGEIDAVANMSDEFLTPLALGIVRELDM
jgi:hypothetical protein